MQPETKEFDPFASASEPTIQTYDLFGLVEINAWACALVKGQGKVPFDPNSHDKRFTAIDVFIQPLVEIEIKYPKSLEAHWLAEFAEWAKTTLPSIKAAGFYNVREINGKWARVARVPTGKKYPKKDKETGELTGEMGDETTFKFVEFFADEDECRAAYLAAGGQPSNGANGQTVTRGDATATTTEEQEKATAYSFLKVIVTNAARGIADYDEAKEAVVVALAQYPTVSKFYTIDSPSVMELIMKATSLPFQP